MSTKPEPREQPRRLRALDVIDQLQATIERLTERRTSSSPSVAVDFTRNAKGDTQTSVKVTANMDCDLTALPAFLDGVYAEAQRVYERATMRYPTASGKPTNDPPPGEPRGFGPGELPEDF